MSLKQTCVDALESFVAKTPNKEKRQGQMEMMGRIADAIDIGAQTTEPIYATEPIYIEAGTGIGKTLAYTLPSLLALKQGKVDSVYISTYTKALQDQFMGEELAAICKHIGYSPKVTKLKGRKNYVCRQKVEEVRNLIADSSISSQQLQFDELTDFSDNDFQTEEFQEILDWAGHTTDGEFSNLKLTSGSDPQKSKKAQDILSVGPRECHRDKCPKYETCFAEDALLEARESGVVVLNHHLLCEHLSDLEKRILKAENEEEPKPRFGVVMDEAHHVEDVATQSFGFTLDKGKIQWIVRQAEKLLGTGGSVGRHLETLNGLALDFEKRLEESYQDQERILSSDDPGHTADLLSEISEEISDLFLRMVDSLNSLGTEIGEAAKSSRQSNKSQRIKVAITNLADDLFHVSNETFSDRACFVEMEEFEDKKIFTLQIQRLVIGGLLKSKLGKIFDMSIFCSATLSKEAAEDIGLGSNQSRTYSQHKSPYDYAQNAKLLLFKKSDVLVGGSDFLSPSSRPLTDEETVVRKCEHIFQLIQAAQGRTLALFSSNKRLKQSVDWFKSNPDFQFPILVQGDSQFDQLVEQFKDNPKSCLFGTKTFWEGVDIPGESLSLVTIDLLPFYPPTSPMHAARKANLVTRNGLDKFWAWRKYEIPRIVNQLNQATGRLIRRGTDKGVVAILDDRMLSKSYGIEIRQGLLPFSVTADIDEAIKFLRKCRGAD